MRIANPNPVYCSGCFNQSPNALHVDFEVSWDGPVMGGLGDIKVPIDDLYLCETCLGAAVKVLEKHKKEGFTPPPKPKLEVK